MRFLGNSLPCLRDFPEDAGHDAGYQLDQVQRGEQPDDFKPLPSVGKGAEEIRATVQRWEMKKPESDASVWDAIADTQGQAANLRRELR